MRQISIVLLVFVSTLAFSQDDNGAMAIMGKVSSLGAGVDLAVAVTPRNTVRFGANAFNYGRRYDRDGVTYHADLRMLSVNALWDFFPMAGRLHLSGGALLYNGNKIDGRASVPANALFDLGPDTYRSSPTDPIHGTGVLRMNKIAPLAMIGFGNPAHGENKLAVSLDVGVALLGTPNVKLSFAGTACDSTGLNCLNTANDAAFQKSVKDEQDKMNRNISAFKFFPVVQLSVGYRF